MARLSAVLVCLLGLRTGLVGTEARGFLHALGRRLHGAVPVRQSVQGLPGTVPDLVDGGPGLLVFGEKAGLPPERFHNFRHTAASIGFAEGLDPKMIQAMLGHSTIGVTMDTYTHLIPALQKEGAERIGKALGA